MRFNRNVFLISLTILYIFSLAAGAAVIYLVSIRQTRELLADTVQRIQQDITYKDGRWDMSRYHADPEVPGSYRLYIITNTGYVIERWRPIPGHLDTSNAKELQRYTAPQTVNTVTGQAWRIYAQPIVKDGQNYGAVAAASANPEPDSEDKVDARLAKTVAAIRSKISIDKDQTVTVGGIDERALPYDLSVQVVDQYHRIILKNNNTSSLDGIPNFIDPSYIRTELGKPTERQLTDSKSGERFMVQSRPLYDNQRNAVGTVIIGRTISPLYELLRYYIIATGAIRLLVFVCIAALGLRLFRAQNNRQAKDGTGQGINGVKSVVLDAGITPILVQDDIQTISFSKASCTLRINDRQIPITYATNQYYLCVAIFGSPHKKWETDVLLDKFGEELHKHSWRKVYDAMAALNKKTAEIIEPRLVVNSNKTYQLNPALAEKLSLDS